MMRQYGHSVTRETMKTEQRAVHGGRDIRTRHRGPVEPAITLVAGHIWTHDPEDNPILGGL